MELIKTQNGGELCIALKGRLDTTTAPEFERELKPLLGFLMAILRFADRHGLLPRALVKASPFHASMLISNLASIRTNHIYHHVYEFGTTGVAIAMGNPREIPKTSKGEVVLERCIPLGIVMDERLASGHYFAQVFAYVKDLLRHPEKMETPLE